MHYAMHCKTVKSTILELWRVSTFDHGRRDAWSRSAYSIAESSDLRENFSIDLRSICEWFFFLSSYYFLFFFFLFSKYVNVVENRKKMENRKLGAKEGGEAGKILKFIVFFTCSLLDEYPTHRRCRLSSFEDWRQGARGGLVQLHQQQVAWKNDPGFFVLLHLSDAFPLMNHFFTNIIFLSPIIPLFFSILELLWIFPRKKKKKQFEYLNTYHLLSIHFFLLTTLITRNVCDRWIPVSKRERRINHRYNIWIVRTKNLLNGLYDWFFSRNI